MNTFDGWTPEYLIDKVFIDLMENGKKKNKYIEQMVDKFKFFSLKSPDVCFDIYEMDLSDETIKHKDLHLQDCKTKDEKYSKLNPIFTEVIARITEQAKPQILAGVSSNNIVIKRSLNEIRELVSFKWKLIGKDGIEIRAPNLIDKIKSRQIYYYRQ
jgi:hypothetical protein